MGAFGKYGESLGLTFGSLNPYKLFLIFWEIVSDVACMIDESRPLKNKSAEMIPSLLALQTACAKVLPVNPTPL